MANIKSNRSYKMAEATKTVNLDGDTLRRILVLRSDGGVLKTSQTIARADGRELSGYERRRAGFRLIGTLKLDGAELPGAGGRRAGSPLGRPVALDAALLDRFRSMAERNGYTVS